MLPEHPDLLFGLPEDFPTEHFVATLRFLGRHQTDAKQRLARIREWGTAMNAVAYRFRLCAESDNAFTELHRRFGDNLPHEVRAQEANHLFVFFLAGQAAVESLVYAVHAMPAVDGNRQFRVDTMEARQKVNLQSTAELLRANYLDAAITESLHSLRIDERYLRWQGVRNMLTHRLHPSDTVEVHIGGPPIPSRRFLASVEPASRPMKGVTDQLDDVPLNADTTASRRYWLSGLLTKLMGDTAAFAESLFGHLPHLPHPS